MSQEQDLFICEKDLYRMGNSKSPRLDHVRPKDIFVYDRGGVSWVRANNRGISLFTWEEIQQTPMIGWIWKLPAGTSLPIGLSLHSDRPGHYMLVPSHDMRLEAYRALLGKVASFCNKVGMK